MFRLRTCSIFIFSSSCPYSKRRQNMADDNKPTPEAIKTQLQRILQSPEFRGSEKQRNFLKFIVAETLEGRKAEIKGYTVAVSVYGRSENFDPQIDPIVRVEAGRLRRALEHYYLTVGKNDPVRITIPKGTYVPAFQAVQMQLGHSSIATTERYLGLSQQRIQDAVDKLCLAGEEEETPSSKRAVIDEVESGEVVLDMTVPRQLNKSPERMEAVEIAMNKAFGKRIPGLTRPTDKVMRTCSRE